VATTEASVPDAAMTGPVHDMLDAARARYLGMDKTRLEHNAAAALNLIRMDAWWTGRPLDRTRTSHLQRLDCTVTA